MTTDTHPKEAALVLETEAGAITIGGMAKGSGMIAPNMATMLSVLTTDAQIDPDLLQVALTNAVNRTFNCVTVDGDTSTNDTVLLLASGKSGVRLREGTRGFRALRTRALPCGGNAGESRSRGMAKARRNWWRSGCMARRITRRP